MAPVVSASLGALAPLLVKLTTLLANECGRLKGVRREIRSLKSELTSMHGALTEYTKLEDPNDQVKAWILLVRELAYDTEDVFDKFIHQLGNGSHQGGFKEFFRKAARSLKTLGSRRKIANQITELKVRIKQVKELKDSYKLNDTSSSTAGQVAVDPRLQALFAEETHLVGVDGPRDDLVKWMVKEGNNPSNDLMVEESKPKPCKVLSIVGFGGLGKTTLANEVYRNVQGYFHCKAFVSVSQKPDIKKIMKDVISQVSCKDGSTKDTDYWDEKKYIAKLREMLQDKRYLIIIDDVWSTQVWNTIKCAFPENNCSSRIIATTRIIDVAKSCCLSEDDRMYEMEPLSDLQSKLLFFRRIFGSNKDCPHTLNKVSNDILKKCGGLPLAIISISSLLANRPETKDEWEKVKRSIGSTLENNQSLEGMTSILSLSYNDLPPNLKTCFLYLSVFPEDYVIERNRLVMRWIAEGFISEERGQSQQEVAENYFYELINKSMVQPVGIGYDGKVQACRVHDMMLEIIISKSAEDNFTTIVGGGQTSLVNRQGIIRRLSIQHIDQELAFALANEDLSHVRSLTVTSLGCMKNIPQLAEFEALRVLDFEGCQGLEEYEMKNIDRFFQLKYLSLRDTDISELPSGIVMLHDLETLDVRSLKIEELPSAIVLLTKLQYLFTEKSCKLPNRIGNMKNLRGIHCFDITESSTAAMEDLGNLTRLNTLSLRWDNEDNHKRDEEIILSSLCKLSSCKLHSLHIVGLGCMDFIDSWSPPLSCLRIFEADGDTYFWNVPKWISPGLTSLTHLSINLAEFMEEDLHTLGNLPSLVILNLRLDVGPDTRLTVIGFPCLKKFELHRQYGAYVTFQKGAMPKLEMLEVSFDVSVAETHGFYLGIEHLPCLKVIKLDLKQGWVQVNMSTLALTVTRKRANCHGGGEVLRVLRPMVARKTNCK
ncbi:hypothetical protein CFC21_075008 [Triticum aestivum]|uniref:Disease resistance protein RPM1 n=2 Tax=Triticum aestivum TaxID=4565 RepID=A0A9R1KWW0_WHEAT|nr:hypothetical protein CFC21_075008 [Triticum aestivum]